MLLLAVDTAAPTGSLAVMRDAHLLGEISTASDEAYSSRLFRQLEFLLRELKIETRDFDVFAVAAGPGSFTGLRVGLTAVKAWAEVYRKPIAAVSGLEAIAAQHQTTRTPSTLTSTTSFGYIASFLDARRGQIFGAIYKRNSGNGSRLGLKSDESILSSEEFLSVVKEKASLGAVDFVSATPDAISPAQLQGAFPGARVSAV